MQERLQIDRLAVKNFRSIAQCDVPLSPITFLVGPNSSGKSNFVDALGFLGSALQHSLEKAFRDRGGINSVLRSPAHLPARAEFRLQISSSTGRHCTYSLVISVESWNSAVVAREECRVQNLQGQEEYYVVEDGVVQGSAPVLPAVSRDRLFLVSASGIPEFRPFYDFLAGSETIEPVPRSLYVLVDRFSPKSATSLTGQVRELERNHPQRLEIIQEYLRAIAPPFDRFEVVEVNDRSWLRFVEKHGTKEEAFYLSQVSAGLLNSAEMLVQLFKPQNEGKPDPVVVIEEPEALLHPGAVRVIRDSFLEASSFRQVIVTSHSPDLLDDSSIRGEWLRTVHRDDTGTHISVLDSATDSILRDRLFTAGELLRQGGLIAEHN